MSASIIDIVLGPLALWLAATALLSANLFRGIVSFIAFGLLLTIIWLRLKAPDVAMAEAAVGAGITGVLLLDALSRVMPREAIDQDDADEG